MLISPFNEVSIQNLYVSLGPKDLGKLGSDGLCIGIGADAETVIGVVDEYVPYVGIDLIIFKPATLRTTYPGNAYLELYDTGTG